MRHTIAALVVTLATCGTADASAMTLDIFSAPGATLSALPGGTASITTTSDQILGGTRDAFLLQVGCYCGNGTIPVTVGFGTGIGGDFYTKSVRLLQEWDAGGAGLNLDATPYGGVFWGGYTTDGGGVLTLRFFTSPTDLFVLQKQVGEYAPIGDVRRGGPDYHEGIYPYSYFTAIGTPNWAQIHTIQVEALLSSSVISVSKLRLTTLPEPVPDVTSSWMLGVIAMVGVAAVRGRVGSGWVN